MLGLGKCVICEKKKRYKKIQNKPVAIGIPEEWLLIEADRFGPDRDACICTECQKDLKNKID